MQGMKTLLGDFLANRCCQVAFAGTRVADHQQAVSTVEPVGKGSGKCAAGF